MRDILPPYLADAIRDRLISGVTLAERGYRCSAGDEDSLTGALGQAIFAPDMQFFDADGAIYRWTTEYFKVRGRGPGAPERVTGADGIFQIRVLDENGTVLRAKGLPFQSKKNWRGTNNALAQQSRQLVSTCGAGVVIDYTAQGYFAADASRVADARGSRSRVAEGTGLPRLATFLGVDFLECRSGRLGLYYDADAERFVGSTALVAPASAVEIKVARIRPPRRGRAG